jgi:HlyD family secretion protein
MTIYSEVLNTHVGSTAIRRRVFSVAILSTVLGVLSLTGCSKPEAEPEPVVSAQIVEARSGDMHLNVEAQAILFPVFQSTLVPKISAPVKKFYVDRGSRVHRGQLLAVLENRDLAAAAEEGRGTYEEAAAGYKIATGASLPEELRKAEHDAAAAKQALDAEEKVYQSRQDLFKQGALPRKDLDQSGVTYLQAKNQYDFAQRHLEALQTMGNEQALKAASGQLAAAHGKQEGADAQLSYSEIRSPIEGVITDRPIYPGEMAQAGTPLLTVMDISRVVARPHIAVADAAQIHVGNSATLTVPGEDEPVPAKVTVVSPALDPNSTTVEIWVQAVNKSKKLKPGSSVQVVILANDVKKAVIVAAASVLTDAEGKSEVMVVDGANLATHRSVTTGVREGNDVQIVTGLKAGERLIGIGAYGLPDKTKVQPEEVGAEKHETKGADKADKTDIKKDANDDKQDEIKDKE